MRINNNITAMTAVRYTNLVRKDMGKTIGKLSSGKRINTAGDDAAGLSISQKMKAQIRGLNKANRNIMDGISLIQTAEGALDTVHNILQRGRSLAVQASNDILTSEDRANIQSEIDQLTDEVDRIANTTEFNNIKLLNVDPTDAVSKALSESIINSLKSGWLESAANLVNTHYGLTESTRDITVVFEKGTPGGALASVQTKYLVAGDTATVDSMTLNIDLSDFDPNTGPDGTNQMTLAGGTMYNDRIIAHEMVHAIMADQMGDDFYDMPTWFKEGTAEFIHGADDRVEADGLAAAVTRASELIDGTASWTGSSLDYSGAYIAVKYIQSNLAGPSTMADIMSDIQDGDDAVDNTMNAIIANTTFTGVADFKTKLAAGGAAMMNITPGAGETDTGSIGGSDHGGANLDPSGVVPTGTFNANPTNFNFIMSSSTLSNSNGSLNIQVGANSGQAITIQLAKVTSDELGINALDFESEPTKAITAFDKAISVVSGHRSMFGALQNRLSHALKISRNYTENLQASESRISDADMAKTSMAFAKNNILAQAAQAMIAQANQIPQGVLRLVS